MREVAATATPTLARVDGEGWEGLVRRARRSLRPGDAVTVVVRPEIVRIGGAASRASAIVWTGVVRQRIFRGTRNLYTVEIGALRVTVEAPPDQTVTPNSVVTLNVDSAHTWAVRD